MSYKRFHVVKGESIQKLCDELNEQFEAEGFVSPIWETFTVARDEKAEKNVFCVITDEGE